MPNSVALLLVGLTLLFVTVLGIPLFQEDNMELKPALMDKNEISFTFNSDENRRSKRDIAENETDDDEEEEEGDADDAEVKEKSDDDDENQETETVKVAKEEVIYKNPKSSVNPLLEGHDDDIELGENTLEDLRELNKFYVSAKAQILGLHKFRISSIPGVTHSKEVEFEDNRAIETD